MRMREARELVTNRMRARGLAFLHPSRCATAGAVRARAHIWPALPLSLAAVWACALSPGCASAAAAPPDVVHAPAPDPALTGGRYAALVVAANDRVMNGAYADALRLADEALRERPFGIEAGVAKVEAHLAAGQRTEALDFAERLRDRHPSRGEAHYACGKAYYALGRLSAAQDAFADGLTRAPADRLLMLAQLTALTHDPAIALGELQTRADELMNGTPADADVLHALAMANEIRADNAAADALYLRAIGLRPKHPFAHYNLAQLRLAGAGMRSARPHFQAFLDQAPPSAVREVEAVRKLLQETPDE